MKLTFITKPWRLILIPNPLDGITFFGDWVDRESSIESDSFKGIVCRDKKNISKIKKCPPHWFPHKLPYLTIAKDADTLPFAPLLSRERHTKLVENLCLSL